VSDQGFSPGQAEVPAGDPSLHQAELAADDDVAARHQSAIGVRVVAGLDCPHTLRFVRIDEYWFADSSG
jgi:hypothetical protein